MKFKFINTILVSLLLSISSIANAGLIQFDVESAGFSVGNYAHLSVDGFDVVNPGTRGVNIAVFDQLGILQNTAVFDTYFDANASLNLTNYINSIGAGSIVLLAVKDEATRKFNDDARIAVQSLGGSVGNIDTIGYRSSYALIGIAGSAVGTRSAFESSSSQRSVSVSDTINFSDTVNVPEPSTLVIFALGMIGLASRRFKK